MTVPEAIIRVLQLHPEGLTAKEITDEIIEQSLYTFKYKQPQDIVLHAIRRHCLNEDKNNSCQNRYFSKVKGSSSEKAVYKLSLSEAEAAAYVKPFDFPMHRIQSINSSQKNAVGYAMKMDAQNQTLRKLLEQYCFTVPDYQRSYSWKSEQINEFLEDLYNILHGDQDNQHHFLGAMTMARSITNESAMDLIDGQQRITTIFIILFVILEEFKSDRFVTIAGDRAEELRRKLMYLNDDGQFIGSRLTLGKFNSEFFEDFIAKGFKYTEQEREQVKNTYRANNKITQNQALCDAYYQIKLSIEERLDCCDNENDAYEYLKALHIALYDHFEAVTMIVEDEADAFLIFETLNDRGLALSSVDLIKNKLFQVYATHPSEFETLRDDWESICNSVAHKDDLKKYLLHFWRAVYGFTTQQSLYKTCRDYIQGHNYDECRSIVKDLQKYSVYYNGFCDPKGNYPWTNEKLKDILVTMNKLRYDLVRPLLLAAWIKYSSDEKMLTVVARLCLNFMIRYISVLGYKPTSIEKDFSKWARDPNFSIEMLSAKFEEKAPDINFKEALETISLPHTLPLTHYLLCIYEAEGCGRKEIWTSPGRGTNTVEHILPQTIDPSTPDGIYWISQFDSKEECGHYSSKLGNYAFLTKRAQSKASNKSFDAKKAVYKTETDMKLTQELLGYKKWNAKCIEQRQKKMAAVWVKYISFNIVSNG